MPEPGPNQNNRIETYRIFMRQNVAVERLHLRIATDRTRLGRIAAPGEARATATKPADLGPNPRNKEWLD